MLFCPLVKCYQLIFFKMVFLEVFYKRRRIYIFFSLSPFIREVTECRPEHRSL